MSNVFIGQITLFAGNFAPHNWASCGGQLLQISQYTALFSLLGTTYGGNGQQTFALPDLRGRLPIGQGQGPGLTNRTIGDKAGAETVTLLSSQIPSHTHVWNASSDEATTEIAQGNILAASENGLTSYHEEGNAGNLKTAPADTVGVTGGTQSHNNVMPFLAMEFIIALFGVYPSRN